ncbi:MAG: efflux RND transporter periplasmic adaptor subunit, partial [Jaaginema sp. PMC 1079.18]|nr:efflux RND transporter periplasmic adaptor subunit [Jaaginema sp. PMC 1079.18]
AQVAAIEAEIAGIEAEIVGLQGQLTAVQKTVTALTSLQSHGAIREADLWEAQGRLASLTADISQRRGLMAAKRQEIEQQHGWMAAKTAQMDEVDFQFAKTALAARDDYQAQATYTETARTEVATAEAHLRASQELAARWQLDVQQLEQQRSQLTLVATHAGTVITPDLDLLDGTRLEAGQELLTVVDLQQLTAEVEIRQEDLDWVQPGARVRFRRPADARVYEAVVTDAGIVPVVQTSEQQQRPMLKVRILIDNSQEFLLPGVEGYAHIQTPKVCLARKVSREFQKLFPWGKFFSWL